MTAPRSRTRATLALLVVTLIWGGTFVWMKQGIQAGEALLGPSGRAATIGLYMTLRFALGAVVLPVVVPAARRGFDRGVVLGGALIGTQLLIGFLLQMFGLQGISPAVSAFLTSLYVVFTALIAALIARRLPRRTLILGALLATLGAAYIGGPPELNYGWSEGLTIAGALVFAFHILATDRVTRRHAPLPVTTVTLTIVAVGSALVLAWTLRADDAPTVGALTELARDPAFLKPMLLASLLATVLAISLMNVFQRDLDPVRAAILYALEPVWAAIYALSIGQDHPNFWLWLGGGALLTGNLVAELGPLLKRRRA